MFARIAPTFFVSMILAICPMARAADFDLTYYRGEIGKSNQILLEIMNSDGKVSGSYVYVKRQIPLELAGTLKDDGSFSLAETVDEKETGRFAGNVLEDGKKLEGTWTDADGKSSAPFSLQRFAHQKLEETKDEISGSTIESSFACPVFEDPSEAALNEAISSHMKKAHKAFVDEIRKAADPSFQVENMYDVDADVSVYTPGEFVSLVFTTYVFTGGAHGMTQYSTLNLRLSPQGPPQPIKLTDLFTSQDTALTKLSEICLADLKKQKAGFVVDGMVDSLDWEALRHFSLSPAGILFLFEPYAVAPYAEGTFDVVVPFDALSGILKPDAIQGIVPQPKQ
ncbi:MAG: DUF3298 and DUF4163 domain-containing protein [Candidatus Hydrogenedentes bacterium]|nr:DUF3298 and DUF4163 domain-containing protein [Candidatus Hydrogenedentota bacterium]